MRALLGGAALVVVALAVGCAGGGSGGSGGGGGGGGGCKCQPPGCPTLSLAQNIQPIFDRSCAQSTACHAGGAPPQDMNLSRGLAHSQTVRVHSTELPQRIRVIPGNPDNSFLVQKIEYPPGTPGTPMPQGCPGNPVQGAVCLSPDDIAAIRQWITECAPDN